MCNFLKSWKCNICVLYDLMALKFILTKDKACAIHIHIMSADDLATHLVQASADMVLL